jgi:lysophospholipase L1-like esterase
MHLPWPKIVAALLAVACTGLACFVLLQGISSPASDYQPPEAFISSLAAAESAQPVKPVVALFIGDAYTAGHPGVRATSTYAALTCRIMGWTRRMDAVAGTGYVAAGSGYNYQDRLYSTVNQGTPDLVFVTGGRDDTLDPAISDSDRKSATRNYLAWVQGDWPNAKIFVLSPFSVDGQPDPKLQRLRAEVRSAAAQADLTWVDTADWLDPKLSTDGVYPTGPGHAAIANHLVEVLRQAGIGSAS